ncbi:MAG: hypothetical protein DRI24_22155 [Deltaproteobacteria bacterium]|nr:MAG: hypothetical protein DRI24_22155 [Deltaproteobacteria bacterium]
MGILTREERKQMSTIAKGTKLKLHSTYQVGKQIGDGGFGSVYEAKNVKTGQKVAIKLFKPDAFTSPVEARMYWERERDITKATTGYSKRHMGYVEAYEDKSNRQHPKFYIVLDFIENATTLKNWFNDNLRSSNPLKIDEMIEFIFIPLCEYMFYAQKQGAIHRDFTFNNIMIVTEQNHPIPIVIDWGGGKLFDPNKLTDEPPKIDDMGGSGTVIITPGFFAPEIIMQKPPLPQTDIYMFGAVLFYALTNGYTRVKPTVSSDYILHPQDYNIKVSDTLNEIVEMCTQYEPRDRFRTFKDIQQAIELHLSGKHGGLDQLPSIETGNSFVLRILNNNAIIAFNNLFEMELEVGKNLRVGRELMIESAAWKESYRGVFRGISRCRNNGVDRPREQFFIGYSRQKNIFFIHEGRNSNPTLLDGMMIPPDQWIPINANQQISIKSTTVRGIFELISVLDL